MASQKGSFVHFSGKRYDTMMGRCYRKNDGAFKSYGAKGVRVCAAWIRDIDAFREWVLTEFKKHEMTEHNFNRKLQIDRKNSKGHYTPENCRLVTAQMNQRNKVGVIKFFKSAEGEMIKV